MQALILKDQLQLSKQELNAVIIAIDFERSIAIITAFNSCFDLYSFSLITGRASAIIINNKEINKIIFLALFEKYWLETESFSNTSFEKYLSNEFFLVSIKNIKIKVGISIK